MAPEPAAGIGNLREVGFFEQNKLRVARDPARESIGQADAAVCGSAAILSAPPRPAAVTAMVVRSMFT